MMKSTTLLSLLLATAGVFAVELPPHMEDGLYEWSVPTAQEKRDGASGWTYIGQPDHSSSGNNAPVARNTDLHDLDARDMFPDQAELECYPDAEYDPSSWMRAEHLLKEKCDDGFKIKKKGILLYNIGSTYVFACNYWGNQEAPCSSGELDAAMARIEDKCPDTLNPLGWFRTKKWNKSYGRNNGWIHSICPGLGGDNTATPPHDEVR